MTDGVLDPIAEERERLRMLRWLIYSTEAVLYQAELTPMEGVRLIVQCRHSVLGLFPGSGRTFDLLCQPRLLRILHERFGPGCVGPEGAGIDRPL